MVLEKWSLDILEKKQRWENIVYQGGDGFLHWCVFLFLLLDGFQKPSTMN